MMVDWSLLHKALLPRISVSETINTSIHFQVFPSEASELLPVFNKTSQKKYDEVSVPISDWTDISQTGGLHIGPTQSSRVANGKNQHKKAKT